MATTTTTVIRAQDTAAGYAYYFADHGIQNAQANLDQMQQLNPALGPAWMHWQVGAVLFLPATWVASAGLPPLPTSVYQAQHEAGA